LKSIEIPNSVTVIGTGAFDSCEGLKTVRIERHIQQIGGNAFAGLYNLTDFYCLAEQIPTTGSWAFDETSDNATLHVPASALDAYKSAAQWNEFKDIVALTEEETKIEQPLSPLPRGGELYNLQGQRISVFSESSVPSVLPKGVYIVDGKKVWVK
jgi:hypothetical protein